MSRIYYAFIIYIPGTLYKVPGTAALAYVQWGGAFMKYSGQEGRLQQANRPDK